MIKNFCLLWLLSVCVCMSAGAAPAYPGLIPFRQPDGSVIMLRIEGDEYSRRLYSESGERLVADDSGWLRPALSAEPEPQRASRPMQGPGYKNNDVPRLGDVRVCVLLVEFSDVQFTTPDAQAYFTRFFNEPGFSEHPQSICSVREYFMAQSGGRYRPQFDVLGPVKLDYAIADKDAPAMITDAARLIDEEVDFSIYDCNDDGRIDCVCLMYAGINGSYASTPGIPWPHFATMSSSEPRDDKWIGNYICCGELGGDNSTPNGPGTFVHEFSHALGLPDHYSVSADQAGLSPGTWDIMHTGCYLPGPCNYSAHQRMAMDWAAPAAVLKSEAASVTLPPLDERSSFFVKLETGRYNDYYLLECRDRKGLDAGLPGSGMLIWHIDATHSGLASFPNQNQNHLAVELMRADNETGNLAGDAWPGPGANTCFGTTSVPAMTRWVSSSLPDREKVTGKEISAISRDASTGAVTFDFNGGSAGNIISPSESPLSGIISVSASPACGGRVSLSSGGTSAELQPGESCELLAEANDSYDFLYWSRRGEIVSYAPRFSLSAESTGGEYIACFQLRSGATADYCYPAGTLTEQGAELRHTEWLTVQSGNTETRLGALQSGADSPLYYDMSDRIVTALPGSTLTITPTLAGDSNTHVYFYIDWERDGFHFAEPDDYLDSTDGYRLKSGSDLVFFSNWSPATPEDDRWYSSMPEPFDTDDGSRYDASRPFSITIPDKAMPREHRVRFKCQHRSLDPCGGIDASGSEADLLENMGGIVVDFTLKVVSRPASNVYEFSTAADPAEGGTALVNGDVYAQIERGNSATFTATAAPGYKFTHWSNALGKVSENPEYVLNSVSGTTQAGVYTAHFEPSDIPVYELSVVCEPLEGGTATVNGADKVLVEHHSAASFMAVPNPGYQFSCWKDKYGNQLSSTVAHDIPLVTAFHAGVFTALFTPDINTGVTTPEGGTQPVVIHDLQGRRLSGITSPGIYIVNGRKTIITR